MADYPRELVSPTWLLLPSLLSFLRHHISRAMHCTLRCACKVLSCEVVSSSSGQEKLLANGDATGDGGVHRAQRVLAAQRLGLDVRPRR